MLWSVPPRKVLGVGVSSKATCQPQISLPRGLCSHSLWHVYIFPEGCLARFSLLAQQAQTLCRAIPEEATWSRWGCEEEERGLLSAGGHREKGAKGVAGAHSLLLTCLPKDRGDIRVTDESC